MINPKERTIARWGGRRGGGANAGFAPASRRRASAAAGGGNRLPAGGSPGAARPRRHGVVVTAKVGLGVAVDGPAAVLGRLRRFSGEAHRRSRRRRRARVCVVGGWGGHYRKLTALLVTRIGALICLGLQLNNCDVRAIC